MRPIITDHCSMELPRIKDATVAWIYSSTSPQAPVKKVQVTSNNLAHVTVDFEFIELSYAVVVMAAFFP
jgi:hypothetical protein